MAGTDPTNNEARTPTFTVEEVTEAQEKIDLFNQVFDLASHHLFNRRFTALGVAQIEENPLSKEEMQTLSSQIWTVKNGLLGGSFCCDICMNGSNDFFNIGGTCAHCVVADAERFGTKPNCCDYHATEGMNDAPCATWQGGSNYSPNFEGEESNELFRSHVLHQIDTNGLDLPRLVLNWDSLFCPADCADLVEFREDGDGIHVCCDTCEVGAFL